MGRRNYRSYTAEFKLEALELLQNSGKSAGQIERELAIRKSQEGLSLEPSDMEAAKAEIRRLRRELVVVKEEREILKKALNIFSRRSA